MPDYNKLPEKQRPILNPQLQLSAIYFLQELRKPGVEPDKEALKELEEEMSVDLVKSTYLMPVEVRKRRMVREISDCFMYRIKRARSSSRFFPIPVNC